MLDKVLNNQNENQLGESKMTDCKCGILDIDVYKSSRLKESQSQDVIEKTFSAYHALVTSTFGRFGATRWSTSGDGAIFIFETPRDAIDASIRLAEDMIQFNQNENKLDSPFFIRIGITVASKEDCNKFVEVPEEKRTQHPHAVLDEVGHLQKECPIGKIIISKKVYHDITRIRKDIFRSTLLKKEEDEAFVLRRRLVMPQEERLLNGLIHEQKMSLPALPFLSWDEIRPETEQSLAKLNTILREPLIVILGESNPCPNSPISEAATSDAVGILEIIGALPPSSKIIAGLDQWEDTADLAIASNIILIGSGIVNTYSFAFNDLIDPAHFVKNGGRIFDQIITTSTLGTNGVKYFGPHTHTPKDCGLIVICKNPFNLKMNLLWIAGITGMGTQAAAAFVLDLIRRSPQSVLSEKAGEGVIKDPIACIVCPSVTQGTREISEYYQRWRIPDYRILWMCDGAGVVHEPPI